MAQSVKKNFGYNLVLTFCNYLFPLLTYPYVSRVLGVDKIGTCNFVDSLINYFVLFAALGVGSYGVREIAKCRDDLDKRNRVFSNLVAINFLGTSLALIVLVCLTLMLPALQSYREFLWVGVLKLVFSMFLIEWFFQGIQEFRYITIRSVFVRLIYVIGVFVFVHTKEDAVIYFVLTVMTTVLNALCNWFYSRRFCSFRFNQIAIGQFILPVLVFGYYRLLTYMYTTFNTVFLGFSSGDREVGYFTTATKLYSILMGVFTAFTTVMVPKVSQLISEGNLPKLQKIANQTFSLLSMASLPIIMFCVYHAESIILLIAGPGYEGAITPFRIVIFLLFIIGMEQIVVQQFLMASTSNKSILTVSTVGAVTGIALNFILTPTYGAVGSSVAWGISEFTVLCTGIVLMKRYVKVSLDALSLVKSFLGATIYVLLLAGLFMLQLSCWVEMMVSATCFFVTFLLINLKINRNEFVAAGVNKIFHTHF